MELGHRLGWLRGRFIGLRPRWYDEKLDAHTRGAEAAQDVIREEVGTDAVRDEVVGCLERMLGQHVVRSDVFEDSCLEQDGRLEPAAGPAEAIDVKAVLVHLARNDVWLISVRVEIDGGVEGAVGSDGAVLALKLGKVSDNHS
eukprot:scaffold234667_cov30-Tisochrysis_lutea.AAC.4